MLTSALEQYRDQQVLTALGVREVRRVKQRDPAQTARRIVEYQLAAIALSAASIPDQLAEQGIEAPPEATIGTAALLTNTQIMARMLESAESAGALDRLVATLIQDAGRTATTVDIARRPAVTGYVRSLNPPSCGRCAVLAGRIYRYSTGFQRHPLCDCLMTPTTNVTGRELITDPTDLVENGQITGLSKGDLEALSLGADLGKVVNVRRKKAGLTVGSSVMRRAGRLTPQGILALASDREQHIELLKRYGYLL